MDDPHRKPGDKDRDALAARIKRAAEQGRIGAADRDIRLANVASAQSMAELDLIRRELDQLETTLPSGSTVTPGWTGPTPLPVADEIADKAVDAAKATARSIGVMTAVILVVLLVGAGVSALLAFSSSSDSGGNPGLRDPLPITAGPGADTSDEPPSSSPGRSAY